MLKIEEKVAKLSKRELMAEAVSIFKSKFCEEFGFNPIVIFEDLDVLKIRTLRQNALLSLDELVEICNSTLDETVYPGGIRNRSRKHDLCVVRQIYMYFAYKFNFTVETSARKIGYDHSMVIHSVRAVSNAIETNDQSYTKVYGLIYNKIKERTGIEEII